MWRLRGFRWWHGLLSVLAGAALGAVTNLVTSTFSWSLAAAAAGLVAVQIGLLAWQITESGTDGRPRLDEVLAPLRPERQDVGMVFRLTASYCPSPVRGRAPEIDKLVSWCIDRDESAGVVRMIAGPAGVGKSRLAIEVAERLPQGWLTGRLTSVAGAVDRIAATSQPALIVVEDAENLADLDTLLRQAGRHPAKLRILVLTRAPERLPTSPSLSDPVIRCVLAPVGGRNDRKRWYGEAVRAYAEQLGLPVPELTKEKIGDDEDTFLLLQARALLAVLDRPGRHRASLAAISSDLVGLETQRWTRDALPLTCDAEVLAEAVTVLMLLTSVTTAEAAGLLSRVPQFSHESAQETRVVVARWAFRQYSRGLDGRLDVQPHLVGERLLLDTLARTPELLAGPAADAVPVLARACRTFSGNLPVLLGLVDGDRSLLPTVCSAVIEQGIVGSDVDTALADLVRRHGMTAEIAAAGPQGTPRAAMDVTNLTEQDLRDVLGEDYMDRSDINVRLEGLHIPDAYPRVRCALQEVHVQHCRILAENQPMWAHGPDLVTALLGLASLQRVAGVSQQAVVSAREAVEITRKQARQEPDERPVRLAFALDRLSTHLSDVGLTHEALEASTEATVILQSGAAQEDPDDASVAESYYTHAHRLSEAGRYSEAAAAIEKAVHIYQALVSREPGKHLLELVHAFSHQAEVFYSLRHHDDALTAIRSAIEIQRELADTGLGDSLVRLAHGLSRLDQNRDALAAATEATEICRQLAADAPDQFKPALARALHSLARCLNAVTKTTEAVKAMQEAVLIQQLLAERSPERYQSGLALLLTDFATILSDSGDSEQALKASERAQRIQRALMAAQPDENTVFLAYSLANHAVHLWRCNHRQQATKTLTEATDMYRALAEHEPEAHRDDLARCHLRMATMLEDSGKTTDAIEAYRDAAALLRSAEQNEPASYGSIYRATLVSLRKALERAGRHDEAAAIVVSEHP
ncbi:tetratricopeptide (TPR) repeat protein [Kibdelosporangium banguiense]|uniref:Tetratricopeptide (TPR) repeat protein n=1 Tax=Kibdelosporangium banguiense TaxID=1365924 RepID=A0ABS4TV44_9PSEU|nr:tetratricopeptide repeat protein [Kibdelosporangium banguiense]MBP2327849.1 tetratricopeptide (TPR) repeat protein [Kibdelosporangium banguiense]